MKISQFLEYKELLTGLLVCVAIGSYFTQGNLVDLFSYTGPHQPINAWKIYQIEKNNLNPLHYDVELEDLSGGKLVSYWDTPLPYLVSLVFSKILTPFGNDRFLMAVKLTTLLNFCLGFVVLYFLAREVGVNKWFSSSFALLTSVHQTVLYRTIFLHLSGVWSLAFPILMFLRYVKKPELSGSFFLGLALALSFLQTPYDGYFSATFIFLPLLWRWFKELRSVEVMTAVAHPLVMAAALLVPILLIKGLDVAAIYRDKIANPEGKDYSERQVRVYRPWFHLVVPAGHPLEKLVDYPLFDLNQSLVEKGVLDYLTLWRLGDTNNQAYIGVVALLVCLAVLTLAIRKCGFASLFKKYWIYVLSLVVGMMINFRADLFVFGKHLVMPWYRLQTLVPLTSLHRYSTLVIVLFYLAIFLLLKKVVNRRLRRWEKIVAMLVVILALGDVTKITTSSCRPVVDQELTRYLNGEPDARRAFFQIPDVCDGGIEPEKLIDELANKNLDTYFGRDGRYYQVFHQTPFFAPNSIAWLDLYAYHGEGKEIRALSSILTDDNEEEIKAKGIGEIVLLTEFGDARRYWDTYLSSHYRSRKEVEIFKNSIVFKLK